MLKKPLTYIFLFLIMLNAIIAIRIFSNPISAKGVYFLDVGQADSELVLYEGMRILIDTGKDTRASDELENILGGKKYIDIVILTHNDTDHAGGVYQLLERFTVGALLLGNGDGENWDTLIQYAQQKNIKIKRVDKGDLISYKNMRMIVLWPDPLYITKNDNEKSLVLKMESQDFYALFAADITGRAEKILTELYNMDADVLKVPHHGSKFSSSGEFLRAVSPALSIIEVGKNSYGHPTEEVLQRLRDVGSQTLRTDENGTIYAYFENGEIQIQKLK